jgi:hypothetical protein
MVAWLALAISLASLAILVWDKFLRRARFDLQADWILSSSEPALRFVVFNVGSRKGAVRDIRLKERAMPRGRGWSPYERVLSRLPMILDPDAASEPFLLQVQPVAADTFEDALRTGRIDTVEIENARGEISVFALPDLHRAHHNALTNAGPDMPRTTP